MPYDVVSTIYTTYMTQMYVHGWDKSIYITIYLSIYVL